MIATDRGSDSAPQIPPEVWTLIFEHLGSSDLSRARLTCRRWNQLIVGSPSLLGKFELKLLEKTLHSEGDPIKDLLASSTIRFSRVLLHGETFIDAGTWWPRIGRNLQVMEMRNRVIDIPDLLELLRGTPRLKVLKVCSKYSAEEETIPQIDFALDSLEVLELETDCPADLLCMLAQMCPRLKEFRLNVVPIVGLEPESVLREVIDFIRAVRNSLESVSVSGTEDNLLEELLDVEGLRLKRVSLACCDREILSEPGKEQLSVEELRVNICSDEVLCNIGKTLPNLKKLSCGFFENQPTIVQFLSFMPKLKCLQITSQWIKQQYRPQLDKVSVEECQNVTSVEREGVGELKRL
ncbi:hypothetical protein pipiens_012644 [Culex pipiens pipiens]|uniref:F-box domain-containing protein n=1 Tax=Culex pipiens pipiens TaxID=38569 RepID=A0ABD1D1H3_CULPP